MNNTLLAYLDEAPHASRFAGPDQKALERMMVGRNPSRGALQ